MATVAPFLKELYSDSSLRTNCSGFFKAVARKLDLPLPDVQADPLIEQISNDGAHWIPLGKGTDAGTQAAAYAGQGYLVVALLKAAEHLPFKLNKTTGKYDIPHPYHHGHLSIVLPGGTKDGYPYVISGSIVADGQSDGSKAVKGVWRGVDAPNVQYYRSSEKYPLLTPPPSGK
jgi:hypothetical protein